MVEFPRLIHFIWAGGTRIMPESTFDNVLDWADRHRHDRWRTWLWVDTRTDPRVLNRYRDDYGTKPNFALIHFKDIGETVDLETGETVAVNGMYSRYEIDRLWPNYGASSDILRYTILWRFGGAYFDGDVRPGHHRLPTTHDKPVLVNDNSQGQGKIGNDAFLCAARTEVMATLVETAQAGYWGDEPNWNYAPAFDGYDNRFDSTLMRTGPMMVRRAFHERHWIDDEHRIEREGPLGSFPHGTFDIRGDDNTQGWLRAPIRHQPDYYQALEIAARSLAFEVTYMRMLRVVEHVGQIAASSRQELPALTYDPKYRFNVSGDKKWLYPKLAHVSEREREIAAELHTAVTEILGHGKEHYTPVAQALAQGRSEFIDNGGELYESWRDVYKWVRNKAEEERNRFSR